MLVDIPFRITLAVMTGVYGQIRARFSAQVAADATPTKASETQDRRAVQLLNGFGQVGSLATVAWILMPPVMRWSALPVPTWGRWLGVPLGAAGVLLFYLSHRALGRHWSGRLEVREGHELVTTGPYRWVRHPMYTAVATTSAAALLLSANWLIGLTGVGSAALLARRIPAEEGMMMAAFGDDYGEYAARTGRLLPRL